MTDYKEVPDGICRRCGRAFDDPHPVPDKEGNPEIACIGYCPACNAHVMHHVNRGTGAYISPKLEEAKNKWVGDPQIDLESGNYR